MIETTISLIQKCQMLENKQTSCGDINYKQCQNVPNTLANNGIIRLNKKIDRFENEQKIEKTYGDFVDLEQ
ncbi:UNKNOWN [Stylonychia lemnae]|uniref:Uncharacterized protein n=1 Tax=Stylonychia lemnae TaxID=5949 RepID=A0A077ZTJ7_STYLE|nr:UNKNOWN [Stylonychia lemnae]|eukprot:CDW72660.1 UNKNOWN [Stylonychia lemnae]